MEIDTKTLNQTLKNLCFPNESTEMITNWWDNEFLMHEQIQVKTPQHGITLCNSVMRQTELSFVGQGMEIIGYLPNLKPV